MRGRWGSSHKPPAGYPRLPRATLAVAERGELFEELFFLVAELLRELADQTDVLVAAAAAFHLGMPRPERRSRRLFCVPAGIVIATCAAERRNVDFAAEQQVVDADRKVDVEIVAFALVGRVFLQLHDELQVAVRTAVDSGAALTGEPNALSVADALGNRHVELLAEQHAAGAVALRTESVRFRCRCRDSAGTDPRSATRWLSCRRRRRRANRDRSWSPRLGRAARTAGSCAPVATGGARRRRRTCRRNPRIRSGLPPAPEIELETLRR